MLLRRNNWATVSNKIRLNDVIIGTQSPPVIPAKRKIPLLPHCHRAGKAFLWIVGVEGTDKAVEECGGQWKLATKSAHLAK